MEFLELIDVLT